VRPNVDGNYLGFGHRIGLAAKADGIRSEGVRPKCCPSPPGATAAPMPLERFQVKRRGSRQDERRIKNLKRRFDSIEMGSILSQRKRL
jgi:hypothetical protein